MSLCEGRWCYTAAIAAAAGAAAVLRGSGAFQMPTKCGLESSSLYSE